MADATEAGNRPNIDTIALAVAGIALIGLIGAVAFFAWNVLQSDGWQEIIRKHASTVIGLQAAAALSFAIVVFLRQTDGPIEFEGFGFKFKGASGQVIMWVVCFLAIAGAIKLCWSATS